MKIALPFRPGSREQAPAVRRPGRARVRRTVVAAGALLILAGAFATWRMRAAVPVTGPSLNLPVTRGDLVVTVESGGTVQPAATVELSFRTSGQVEEVLVRPGETVRAGQPLARLDTRELELQVAQAEAALRREQAQLDQYRAYPRPEEVAAAEAALSSAQASLEKLKQGPLPSEITAAEEALAAAEAELQEVLAGASEEELIAAEAEVSNAEAALQAAQAAYDAVSWLPNIGALSQSVELQQATNDYATARARYDELLKEPSEAAVREAQTQVEQARATLDDLRTPALPAEIAAAEAEVRQAQVELESARAGARPEELASAEAGVAEAQANLDAARLKLDQATIRAPFAGTVTEVSVAPGSLVGSDETVVTLADLSTLHLDVNVSESDVARVEAGQPVSITFDALPGAVVTGTVASVAIAGSSDQGVVTYPVEVRFDPGEAPVRPGMSATASVEVDRRADVVQVPNRAIRSAGPVKMLQVVYGENRVPVTVPVETGATNGSMTEIVTCLNTGNQCLREGDEVAVQLPASAPQAAGAGPKDGAVVMPAGKPVGAIRYFRAP